MDTQQASFAIIDATISMRPTGSAVSRYATMIANRPLIGHVLDELAQAGIEEAQVVASPPVSEELDRFLPGGRWRGIDVSLVDVPLLDGRRAVLAETERAVGDGPVLLHPGDCLTRGQIGAMLELYADGGFDVVLSEPPSKGSGGRTGGPRLTDTILVLGAGTRPMLGELLESVGDDAGDDVDVVATLLTSDFRWAVCDGAEHWRYSDATEDLLQANRMLLDTLPEPSQAVEVGDDNQIHGRVSISPDALVSNCVLHGPVVIDGRSVIEDSFVGPYTAIGPDVVLSGTEIDNSIVLRGAEIRHPGFRLEASIIGERARVVRGFELPRGAHMRLGADSRITFT